jgi:parallel beta-helix repeat protein
MCRWLWVMISASCLGGLVCLGLLSDTRAQAGEPLVTSTPTYCVYLPIIMKNYQPFTYTPTPTPTHTYTPTPTPTHTHTPTSTPTPIQQGDWVVTGTEVVCNAYVLLDGNLTVQSGGSLTLRNTRLSLNGTYNGQYGIRVQAGGAITIETGSIVTATKDTAHLTFIVEQNATLVMRDSELHGCGWGIPYESNEDTAGLAIYADNAVLERNLFSNNFNGIMLKGATNIQIAGNQFFSNTWSGISTGGTRGARIAGNSFADGFNGILMADSHDNVITGNSFARHFEGAVFSFYGWNNEISGNYMAIGGSSFQGWVGVSLDAVSGNNRILDNTFIGGMNGVIVHHSLNNTIRGNTITGAVHAMEMGYANDNLIADNVFSDIGAGFSYGALLLYHSSDNQILNNRIGMIGQNSGVILVGSSMSNTIQSNVITSTFRGLSLHDDANSNIIITNTISAEREEAIVVDNSSENLLHHNNFLSSGQSPYDDGYNQWDDGNTGNYWHDYAGTGAYLISPNGVDRYPLSSPISVISATVSALPSILVIPPPWRPTWVITSPTVIANATITVEDMLSIEAGGSLTLTQATLWMEAEPAAASSCGQGARSSCTAVPSPPLRQAAGMPFKPRRAPPLC